MLDHVTHVFFYRSYPRGLLRLKMKAAHLVLFSKLKADPEREKFPPFSMGINQDFSTFTGHRTPSLPLSPTRFKTPFPPNGLEQTELTVHKRLGPGFIRGHCAPLGLPWLQWVCVIWILDVLDSRATAVSLFLIMCQENGREAKM